MVHKGATLGTIENVTVLSFGKGHLLLSHGWVGNTKSLGITECNIPHKVGSKVKLASKKANDIGLDVLMTFDNEKSLDTLIKALNKVKKTFKKS